MLNALLIESNYNKKETEFLTDGFKNGFKLNYHGKRDIQLKSPNLPISIGTETDLWNKVMKEVQNKCYAGPFEKIPFNNYIQSPIGLVPKDGGKATRLIFHLSYPRKSDVPLSVNANTPKHLCTVKYPDFDEAIALCIKEGVNCAAGKSDLKSAFRHFCMSPDDWMLLVMKAKSPFDGKIYYFVDKCMPFGAAISCSHFQRFSNALAHILKYKSGGRNSVNYLDDFFFVAMMKLICDTHINLFIKICAVINFPLSMEKTSWGSNLITFLGLLIDTTRQQVFVPIEKIAKSLDMINDFLTRRKSKVTLKELQKLCGTLNFFGRCIIPGRAFTRRLYALTAASEQKLLPHHHLKLKQENKLDLTLWQIFLTHPAAFCRSFADFSKTWTAEDITFYTDSSRNPYLGTGGFCQNSWFQQLWDPQFIINCDPSINYLELYGVTVGILLWIHRFKNKKVAIFCDNMSVVDMINSSSSTCRNWMILIRVIVLQGLIHNVRICAKHVPGILNQISDSLSRNKMLKFYRLTKKMQMDEYPTPVPEDLWPMTKIWLK